MMPLLTEHTRYVSHDKIPTGYTCACTHMEKPFYFIMEDNWSNSVHTNIHAESINQNITFVGCFALDLI